MYSSYSVILVLGTILQECTREERLTAKRRCAGPSEYCLLSGLPWNANSVQCSTVSRASGDGMRNYCNDSLGHNCNNHV